MSISGGRARAPESDWISTALRASVIGRRNSTERPNRCQRCSAPRRVIAPYHRMPQTAALELGTAEIEEPDARLLIGKISNRIGLKGNVDIHQNIEIGGIAYAVEVFRPLAEQDVGPYRSHDFIGIQDDEPAPSPSLRGLDQKPVTCRDGAQVACIAFVPEGLAVVAAILGNERCLELRRKLSG